MRECCEGVCCAGWITHTVSPSPQIHAVLLTPFCWLRSHEHQGSGRTKVCSRHWRQGPVTPRFWLEPGASQSVWWPHIGPSMQPFPPYAAPILWLHPNILWGSHRPSSSSSCLRPITQGFACQNGFDFLNYLENQIADLQEITREAWPQYLNTICLHLQRQRSEFFMMSKRYTDYFEIMYLKNSKIKMALAIV